MITFICVIQSPMLNLKLEGLDASYLLIRAINNALSFFYCKHRNEKVFTLASSSLDSALSKFPKSLRTQYRSYRYVEIEIYDLLHDE